MNIIKYRPTTRSLLNWEFDNLFDNVFGTGRHYPAVDVREDEQAYVLEADLPGLSEKEIDIKVEDTLLTISSSVKEAKDKKEEGYLFRERRGSSFSRSFVLPKDVDKSKIDAAFNNGVLTLTMAKTPEARPRQIEIKTK